ncbi:hypothetical protein MVEN_02242000 [Mycena venus]|uniref:Uncharacterized protein n=1 Tax=Mycena venus TaxID=2733690 RepID=A0A8H6X5L6_9AGAR|nr:hypothetical protein MVEN_02242000 [Mycena venus]
MFDHCRDVTISGGNFNIVNDSGNMSRAGDFRVVRIGDLNLLSSIGSDTVVAYRPVSMGTDTDRPRRRRTVIGQRKIYSARMFGSQDLFTVFIYEGLDLLAWMAEVAKRQHLRHPNLFQLFGSINSHSMSALIYHDEMVPVSHALARCRSPLSVAYLKYQLSRDMEGFLSYWLDATGTEFFIDHWIEHSEWIRASTGQLCVDLGSDSGTEVILFGHWNEDVTKWFPIRIAVDSFTDEALLQTVEPADLALLMDCSHTSKVVSMNYGKLRLGSLYCIDDYENPDSKVSEVLYFHTWGDPYIAEGWFYRCDPTLFCFGVEDETTNGWTRVDFSELYSLKTSCDVYHFNRAVVLNSPAFNDVPRWWLAQAIHWFPNLSEEYFLIRGVEFSVSVYFGGPIPATGTPYLFLFPPRIDIECGRPSVYLPPRRQSYYWSFEGDGTHPLSDEMLANSNDLKVLLEVKMLGLSWSQMQYQLLQDLFFAKGFNPYSPDIVMHLDYPLAIVHEEPVKLELEIDTDVPDAQDFPLPFDYCPYCEDIQKLY